MVQVEHLVETVNQVRDKLDRVDKGSRRSGSKLTMWIEIVREETETEKGKERKVKEKRKIEERMEIDGSGTEVIEIKNSYMEGVKEQ